MYSLSLQKKRKPKIEDSSCTRFSTNQIHIHTIVLLSSYFLMRHGCTSNKAVNLAASFAYLILSGTLWVWFPSIMQFPAKLVPRAPAYSLRKAIAPCVSTDTPFAIRRRGSSLHPCGLTANRALGRPSRPSPDRAGPTANHICEGVACPDAHAALKMCSASSCEQYRSRTCKEW